MRDRYEDSPGETRDASMRRLGRLTWRATQLGTLAAVGFAVVFARNAPAETTTVQNPPTARPTASATAAASATPSQHAVIRAHVTSSPTRKPAVAQLSAPAAQRAAPTTVATTQLAPPTTPPAPAPTTAAPAPTTSSASHGGG